MGDDRASSGLLISALGSAVLAVSMFLPWYSVSVTAAGAAAAQQQLSSVAQQYGNSNLQAMANQVGAGFNSVVGRQLTTVSAHEVLKDLSVVLLLLAGVSLLASLLRLADVAETSGGQIALLGGAAILCVLFRMLSPPVAHTDLISLSPSWGSWLALGAATAIVFGGLWTPPPGRRHESPAVMSRDGAA
jgi:hypothetical protein